jgi:hypothetical protein
MNHDELIRRIGLKKYIELLRKVNDEAGSPPHPHSESGEEQKRCAECQEWQRNFDRIWEKVFRPLENEGVKEK